MNCVNIDDICKYLGIRVLSYDVGAEAIRFFQMEELARKGPWFCCMYGKQPIIFFDSTQPTWQNVFFVAKAVGFFMRGYVTTPSRTLVSFGEQLTADLFALRLLWRIARANPRFLPAILENDLARLAAKRKRKARRAPERRWLRGST